MAVAGGCVGIISTPRCWSPRWPSRPTYTDFRRSPNVRTVLDLEHIVVRMASPGRGDRRNSKSLRRCFQGTRLCLRSGSSAAGRWYLRRGPAATVTRGRHRHRRVRNGTRRCPVDIESIGLRGHSRAHALSPLAGRRCRRRLAIDRPRHAEAVDENAKSGGPERLVQRHSDDPTLRERIEHPARVVGRRGMDDQ